MRRKIIIKSISRWCGAFSYSEGLGNCSYHFLKRFRTKYFLTVKETKTSGLNID